MCVSQVCTKALWLLAQVEQEPLFNLEQLNPELVKHSESMAQAHSLRQRLRLLGHYLLSCRSGACKKLQARCACVCVCHTWVSSYDFASTVYVPPRMEQRTYLLEFSHLYSVLDLRQVSCWVTYPGPRNSLICTFIFKKCIYLFQIAEGQYATYLMRLMQQASKHVYQCDLCTQRGFICQICHADNIIFPFQFDSTTRWVVIMCTKYI